MTAMMSRRVASRLAMTLVASRHRATTAIGLPAVSTIGKNSCTSEVARRGVATASFRSPLPSTAALGRPARASTMSLLVFAVRPTASASLLASTRPLVSRISMRRMPSLVVRLLRRRDSSSSLDPLGPSPSRSEARRLPFTKSSTSDASRLITLFRIAVDR